MGTVDGAAISPAIFMRRVELQRHHPLRCGSPLEM